MAPSPSQDHRHKRRKISLDGSSAPTKTGSVQISSHKQLHDLLYPQQTSHNAHQGVASFKEFLTSIDQSESDAEKAPKFQILKAYCDSQMPKSEDAVCFPDLIQTWNLAESNNHENILVLVPSVLAQFLKTVSTQLEFREFGIALCKSLLQKEQLRVFNRHLTAPKAKEHLLSPCIRLLTEIVSFDGGAVARLVYAKRDITYKRLEQFLTPNKSQLEENSTDSKRKSTLRRNAQRYVLANLRFLQGPSKSDFIEQHKVIRAFLEFIRRDSREIVIDIIKSIDRDVAHDSSIARVTKSRFFNKWNLERLVTLYGYDKDSSAEDSEISIPNEIHKLLLQVCTIPEMGVLLPQNGWYPPSSDSNLPIMEDQDSIDLGLDAPFHLQKYRESVPVRNGTLSALIQVLRPDSDTLQTELLLEVFKSAPELVADFFAKRVMFTAEPKATPTWLGESAFLFSAVQLPALANCGWKGEKTALPPPVSIVIESILPRPLNQKTLTRCLNQNTDPIVTLFAIRILTASFRKLRAVLKVFNGDHGHSQPFWDQASEKLVIDFCDRCPSIKDVILIFKRTSKEDIQQQEAVMELLFMYHDVIPAVACEENFDVIMVMVDILRQLEDSELSEEDSKAALSLLQNTLHIAHRSASMRWWQQPASFQFSAFTCVLKVLITTSDINFMKQIHELLRSVLAEHSILIDSNASFDALILSLREAASEDLLPQLHFLDNCLCRTAKKPVHYEDLITSLLDGREGPLSFLVATVNEQWPFILKSKDSSKEESVASWLASFLRHLKLAGEDKKALKAVRDNLYEISETKKTKSIFKKASKDSDQMETEDLEMLDVELDKQPQSHLKSSVELLDLFGPLPVESKSHTELYRWENEEIDAAIEQGRIKDLILCLCSKYEEIRRQSFAALTRLMAKLENSKYTEWRSIYLLVGEVRETVNKLGFETPLPYIAGELSASCLTVLTDPLHKMYGKVNKYLQKQPAWEIEKIPSYWIDKIILHEPENDDGYTEEVTWLLDLLVNGLRTSQDLDIYRRANVFEHILSLYNTSTLKSSLKNKILHLLFRATQVNGGTTLITRAAIISWIESCIAASDSHVALLTDLAHAVYESSDKERVDAWSGHTVSQAIEHIAA